MRTDRILAVLALVGLVGAAHAQASAEPPGQPHLNCISGPLQRIFGTTPWYVYGCDDGHSLVVVTAPGSPAMPFYFFFVWRTKGFELHGEGTGNKSLTDAAFADLKALTDADVVQLYKDAAAVNGNPHSATPSSSADAARQPGEAAGVLQEINITSDSASGWLPSTDQRVKVPQITHDFLAALDGGQYQKAYDLMTESQRKVESFDRFIRRLKEFNASAGAAKERRILKITWTKDPANSPAPGVYAAVDLASRFENIDRHCGYIVLYQSDTAGPFLVIRQEDNFMTNEQAHQIGLKQSPQAVDDLWTRLAKNCRNYAAATPGKSE